MSTPRYSQGTKVSWRGCSRASIALGDLCPRYGVKCHNRIEAGGREVHRQDVRAHEQAAGYVAARPVHHLPSYIHPGNAVPLRQRPRDRDSGSAADIRIVRRDQPSQGSTLRRDQHCIQSRPTAMSGRSAGASHHRRRPRSRRARSGYRSPGCAGGARECSRLVTPALRTHSADQDGGDGNRTHDLVNAIHAL